MKLSLKDLIEVKRLGESASNLLVNIMDEKLPKEKLPTEFDNEFKKVLIEIREICPLLSDSYAVMYNHIQEVKISSGDGYYKRLRSRTVEF